MKSSAITAVSMIFFLVASPLAASEPEPPGRFLRTLERSHDAFSSEVGRFAERIDLFLGGNRVCEDSQESYIHAGVSTVLRENGDVRFDRILRARFDLPNTEDRFKLLIESDPERDFRELTSPGARDSTETTSLTPRGTGTSLSAALQVALQERRQWRSSLDAGAQMGIPPDPYTRFRLRRSLSSTHWRFTFGETLFWFASLGIGSSTQFDLERQLSSCLLLRSTTEALWKEQEGGLELRQGLTLHHDLSWREVITYKLGATGEAKGDNQFNDWGGAVEYRRRIYKNWLFFSLEPAVLFSRVNDFRAEPSLRFTVDILFGNMYIQ
jgi:hypothetical protein